MMSRAVIVISVERSRRGAFGRPFSSSSRIQTARTARPPRNFASPFEPFEIGGPLSARRDGEKGLGDETPVRDHGTDEEFEEGQDGAVRNGLGQEGQPGAERGRDRGKHGA